MAGIPAERRLGDGMAARPVLDVSRAALRAYARETGLPLAQDPANEDGRFARTVLRAEVIPVLERRWPGMRSALARAADLGRESAGLLDALAAIDLAPAGDIESAVLDAAPLVALEPARRRNAIAAWLRSRGIVPPGARPLDQIARDVVEARPDAMPCVRFADVEIRRFRGRLQVVPQERPAPAPASRGWRIPESLEFGHGSLAWEHCADDGLDGSLRDREIVVRFRGEDAASLRPMRVRGHSLRKRFQALRIPPWERGRIPLVYADGVLAAIGSEWTNPGLAAPPETPGWRVVWTPRA